VKDKTGFAGACVGRSKNPVVQAEPLKLTVRLAVKEAEEEQGVWDTRFERVSRPTLQDKG
jgi:hypothetical protein